ncbi:hypothetical protein HK097_007970 [Rhizophlyctis rosea]|uniref:Dynactin subunit 4 n=1 Tax=Rhizophlyctis rosea TaxID=64517 RepID=A0AAD5X5K1_9FUNG|nr:hypothetical protein HK097_007970 [Rhizophlyctis rosea]
MSVVEPGSNSLLDAGGRPATPSAAANIHFLTCVVCRWDSLEIGLKFERPTGLAMQLQKTEEHRAEVKEFDHLREHFEKLLRSSSPAGPSSTLLRGVGATSLNLPSSLLASIPGLSSFSDFRSKTSGNGGGAPGGQKGDQRISPYEPLVVPPEVSGYEERQIQATRTSDQVTTLTQRLNQLEDQPQLKGSLRPQRIQLRTKRSKRCRKCEHILIKPEQKAQITRFKIKLLATDYIPTITIAYPFPTLPLQPDVPVNIILKFTNPNDEDLEILLATTNTAPAEDDVQARPPGHCDVTILAPNFAVSAYNEIWEYDDPASPNSPSNAASALPGVHERRRNHTSVVLQVVPRKPPRERNDKDKQSRDERRVEFPLLVNSTRVIKGTALTGQKLADAAESSETGKKEDQEGTRTITDSFWVMVGVGDMSN